MSQKPKVTVSSIRDFVEGNYQFLRPNTPIYIQEQAEYRAYLCHPCLKNKSCLRCGCTTPNMFYSPNKVDSDGKWGKMVEKDEWESFKKTPAYSSYLLYRSKFNPLDPTAVSPDDLPTNSISSNDGNTLLNE